MSSLAAVSRALEEERVLRTGNATMNKPFRRMLQQLMTTVGDLAAFTTSMDESAAGLSSLSSFARQQAVELVGSLTVSACEMGVVLRCDRSC